jgi:single-stranded-DNA-specific exonuclease
MENSFIMVYSAAQQKQLFSEIFGRGVDLNAFDITEQVVELFPRLNGMSLLKMREVSKDARYSKKTISELDILRNLFTAVILKKNKIMNERLEQIMDLVTIGSIADMMPLINENRIMVRHGLKNIQKTANKGLHELLFRQKLLEKAISTSDIAWNITPLINATGRMGVPEKAAQLFFSGDIEEIRVLANEIISLNKERKKVGDNLWDILFNSAKKSFEEMEGSLVIAGGSKVNRGITGILSARFASYFNVPAVIYTVLEDRVVGSIRSMRNYPIVAMMSFCSDLFIDFGGHDFAGGFSMDISNLEDLKKRLIEYFRKNTITATDKKNIEIDAELPAGYLNQEVLDVVNAMMPFGEGNPNLIFLARSLKVKSIEIMGNKAAGHLKLVLDSGAQGMPWPAVFWNAADRAGKDFSAEDSVDIIFKMRNNFIVNNNIPQLDIIDIERN